MGTLGSVGHVDAVAAFSLYSENYL